MGTNAMATFSYGFIIPQPQVLKLLQKLQNTKDIKEFGYDSGEPYDLEELLNKHLNEKQLAGFEISFLTAGEYEFKGLAIVYNGVKVERVWACGFGSQTFEPSSAPWKNEELVDEANDAFKRLGEDLLFKELGIVTDPEWLIGCNMSC